MFFPIESGVGCEVHWGLWVSWVWFILLWMVLDLACAAWI